MTSGQSIYFVDSNVFVYAADPADKRKQRIANDVFSALALANTGNLSAQVIGEAFNTITRKISRRVEPGDAARALEALARTMVIYPITASTAQEAFRGVERYQLSYWDALVWATAKLNGIETVLTEDIQSSGEVEGVRFVNPFAAGFDVASL